MDLNFWLDVIARFELKDVTVVGHPLGCLVALTLAADNPSLVSSLVFFGPFRPFSAFFGPIKALPDQGRAGARNRAEKVHAGGMAAPADTVIGSFRNLESQV